jgi:hypothetical protein
MSSIRSLLHNRSPSAHANTHTWPPLHLLLPETYLKALDLFVCSQGALSPSAHLNSILSHDTHAPRVVTAPVLQGRCEQPCLHTILGNP